MIKRSAITFIFSAAMVLGLGSTAGAQTNGADCSASPMPASCDPGSGVLPQSPATPTGNTDPVVAAPATQASPLPRQTLPVTGSETTALAVGGLLLVSAGGALVWRSNKAAA